MPTESHLRMNGALHAYRRCGRQCSQSTAQAFEKNIIAQRLLTIIPLG